MAYVRTVRVGSNRRAGVRMTCDVNNARVSGRMDRVEAPAMRWADVNSCLRACMLRFIR